ncbi:putative oxidoreductase CzcO [Actinomadura rubteroloni]|uniref:Putative oxidoreductase CzcO n=1 Tax=Actinomadura rubteroloni TaxID=1926885 RepID=A0A2P4ULZ4_9ACTN|nr:NAD(P)-binding domain-containing protein [Actinomadura rubteroloni]POM26074.1 putative oxidoreductase CzcO [Actinomadura rubteroloni]
MTTPSTRHRYCIIGAGYVGNGVAKAFTDAGIDYDQLEATDHIGGNWAHGVYDSAHLISSRRSTQYADHPMPGHYPDFPSAAQMLAYLNDYVDRFGLRERIVLNAEVVSCAPLDPRGLTGWRVETADGEVRHYRGVVVCNGHYWKKNIPSYPGTFTGHQIHSKDYKRPADFGPGPRVLVVGPGNSGSDMAVEAAATFGHADVSMRRGYWFLPKTVFGIPSSELDRINVPIPVQRVAMKAALLMSQGLYRQYGLPHPDHKLFSKDVTVSTALLYALRHGKVTPRPEISGFDGSTVRFADGSRSDYDTIVWATGFHTAFPFLDDSTFVWEDGQPLLIEHVLVPGLANLYVFGLVAPRSGAGRMITRGSRLLAEAVRAQEPLGRPLSDFLGQRGRADGSILAGNAELLAGIRRLRRRLGRVSARTRRPGGAGPSPRTPAAFPTSAGNPRSTNQEFES